FRQKWSSLMNVQANSGTSATVSVPANYNFADAKAHPITGQFFPGASVLIQVNGAQGGGRWVPKGMLQCGAGHTVYIPATPTYIDLFGLHVQTGVVPAHTAYVI